jgi:hypothetical protein
MPISRLRTARAAAYLATLFLVGAAAGGCKDRITVLASNPITSDAGTIDARDSGAGRDSSLDASGGSGGVGGKPDAGSTGGMKADSGVCVPTGQPENCGNNGVDDDCNGKIDDIDPALLATDIANCGKCFNLCNAPNAIPSCVASACQYTCDNGWVDVDGKPGCECQKKSATELCNGVDDNCNGMVDEGFDLMTDLANCGKCGVQCQIPFATNTCVNGVCTEGPCLTGFFDANKNPADGCECQKTNHGVEICDGVDNDCDGVVDNAPTGKPPCKTNGVCAGVTATCMGAAGWSCVYPATYQAVEDTAKGCDSLDNDCDGLVDEAFGIGKACTVGSGACANTGAWVCDATQAGGRRCNGSPKPPQPEICDGLDNDCDGEIDEVDSVANRTSDDLFVYLPARNVTMFAYEGSRYDATSADYGFDSSRRPCSVPGRRPWTNITKEEAAAACDKIKPGAGWRLCTKDEWFDACNGAGNTVFPYGDTYQPKTCNGYDYVASPPNTSPVATGAAALCVSDQGGGAKLYDMSGNVKEWVITTPASGATAATYELRGGAYDIASFGGTAPGLQCDASVPAPSVAVRLPSVGFRCCLTGQLPAQ